MWAFVISYRFKQSSKIVGGRSSKQKNHLFLIKAFSKINFKNKPNLLIIGEGNLSSEIKQFIKKNNIYNVKLLNNVINPFYFIKKGKL